MRTRTIPKRYVAIWSVLAALFVAALFTAGELSWWLSLTCLAWFGLWEFHGVASAKPNDTLSESIWTILNVQDNKPTNRALFPLVMGCFAGAACLFAGVVYGGGDQSMSPWAQLAAALFVAGGTLGFLVRHFRRGDSQ